ncbi:hypothetical protein SERLA73DRAFT_102140 [Serpula lacrymans var. lacrymans S7.3]|uniref:NAD(P)-binding protein n=1 Tax=Serpula lacrymans var. lacrymans (strain S7.3) TaxID=936435 RepID=F8PKC2_SERL3|nr:hypothetical protein SERLA73DRAFT_102140 [Serpula lacrymans var. lacrymans S7.3]
MADTVLNNLSASTIFDLRGIVAVITGGGSGIGLMIGSTLVANGATVYIIGLEQDKLDNIAETYNAAAAKDPRKGRMFGIKGDVRLKSEAARLAEEIGRREKYVTVLFNNAGTSSNSAFSAPAPTAEAYRSQYFDSIQQEDFHNVFDTNTVGPYWLTFAFLSLLERWKTSAPENAVAQRFVPQIIMTSSMNAWTKDSRTAGRSYPYLFSKSALGQATSSLAHELLPLGIRVNGIAPGFFQTELSAPGTADEAGLSHVPDGMEDQVEFQVPAGFKTGSNRDIGSLALFLVANWFVNGETVLIDGGTLLQHASSY